MLHDPDKSEKLVVNFLFLALFFHRIPKRQLTLPDNHKRER